MARNSNLPNKVPKITIEQEDDFWLSQDTEGNFFSLPTKRVEVLDYFHYDEKAIYQHDLDGSEEEPFIKEQASSQDDGWDKLRHADFAITWSDFNLLDPDDE